jgi:hypothetical protein
VNEIAASTQEEKKESGNVTGSLNVQVDPDSKLCDNW